MMPVAVPFHAMDLTNMESPPPSSLYKATRPFFFFLRVFGGIHSPNSRCLVKCYSVCTVTVFWFNAIRILTVFSTEEQYDAGLFIKLVDVVWSLQIASVATVLCYNCSRNGGLEAIYDYWTNIMPACTLMDEPLRSIRRMSLVIMLLGVVLYSVTNASTIIMMFPAELEKSIVESAIAPIPITAAPSIVNAAKVLAIIVYSWLNLVWVFVPLAFVVVCYCAKIGFKMFNLDLSKAGNTDNYEQYRMRYHNLCTLTEVIDSKFKVISFLLFTCNIAMAISIGFWIYDFRPSGYELVTTVYWCVLNLVQALAIMLSGTLLNNEVSKLSDCHYLYQS